ncbi:hypothetical protein BSUW23_01295 [Bacillus spizizenii str. W23]|uniref:Uncharacterized protein n=1 Tax=Bacillus spizizenii (strain ATCC 23059 / NRRL B-14472 / W23) TaxID=655816 RepID=E0U0W3_BACSH|nr:hypothetical protein BSUW23_01295 [Bacillus spizizenii str. W23]EFG91593.1 hypothetical protein BSU6633_13947 [Bacillus spizizenii ATCC 6633 = JCM 2499]
MQLMILRSHVLDVKEREKSKENLARPAAGKVLF